MRMTSMSTRLSLAAALLAVAASAHAQPSSAPETQWESFLGCWTSSPANAPAAAARIVCITPASRSDVVDVTVIADGRVVARDTIDASGNARTVESSGCAGTERASFSADRRRVFLRSNVSCGSTPTEVSAILALTADGEWLDVRGVASPGRGGVQVERYRPVGVHSALPPAAAALLVARTRDIEVARARAGARVDVAAIIEASRAVEPAVVEAWLLESGQTFAADDSTLKAMKQAGVPQQVADAMISANTPSGGRYVRLDELYGFYNDHNIASNAWEMGTGLRKVFVMPVGSIFGFGSFSIYGFPYYDPAWVFGALPSNAHGRRSGIPNLYPPVIKLANNTAAQETKGFGKPEARPAETRPTVAGTAAGAARKVVEKLTSKGSSDGSGSSPAAAPKTAGIAPARGS